MKNFQRVAIVEEALPTCVGHWEAFTLAVADGFRELSSEVDLLGSGVGTSDQKHEITPVFSRSIWTDPFKGLRQPSRLFAKIQYPRMWATELSNYLVGAPVYDLVYAPNQLPSHLLSWGLVLRSVQSCKVSRLGLGVNYYGPPGGGRPSWLFYMQTLLAKALLAPGVRSGRVKLFCENRVAQSWLRNLTGYPFRMVPHAVESKPPCATRTASSDVVTFLSLGFARPDKGSDLLSDAVDYLLEQKSSSHLRWILQWNNPSAKHGFPKRPSLEESAQVDFIDACLTDAEIQDLLIRADFLVLPYRNSSYHARLSRVAVEGVVHGIPLIYPAGSSIGEIASEYGAGCTFQDGSFESLAKCMLKASQELGRYSLSASTRRQSAVQHFSGASHARAVALSFCSQTK